MKYIVSLSGGKDSTAMLLMLLEKKWPVDEILFFNTGWEFPQMYDHLTQLEKYIGRPITRLKPTVPFLDLMLRKKVKCRKGGLKGFIHRTGYGWPSVMRRWCTRLKANALNKGNQENIQYIGIAADERNRAKPKKNIKYPLVEWGITEKAALQYCYDHGFTWGGLYHYWPRLSCFCCPLQRIGSLRRLRHLFPDLWGKMLSWDREISNNRGFYGYKTVEDLERQFAMEDQQMPMFKEGE